MDACVYGGTAAGLGESAEWNGEESLPQRIADLLLALLFYFKTSRIETECLEKGEKLWITRHI